MDSVAIVVVFVICVVGVVVGGGGGRGGGDLFKLELLGMPNLDHERFGWKSLLVIVIFFDASSVGLDEVNFEFEDDRDDDDDDDDEEDVDEGDIILSNNITIDASSLLVTKSVLVVVVVVAGASVVVSSSLICFLHSFAFTNVDVVIGLVLFKLLLDWGVEDVTLSLLEEKLS